VHPDAELIAKAQKIVDTFTGKLGLHERRNVITDNFF
jgi:hypothetical protein